MATGTDPAEAPKTLGAHSGLPGDPLEAIEGKTVTVTRIEITTRRLRDNPDAPFAVITLDDGSTYHTWSAFLIDKLEAIPADALPGVTTFHQVVTAAKRKVWTLD